MLQKIRTSYKIKDMSQSLRPRERLQKYGADYIELNELIAIVIRSGTKEKNALEIAQKVAILFQHNNYKPPTLKDLRSIEGISDTKAVEILAACELGKRVGELNLALHKSIQTAEDCLPYLGDIAIARKEHFVALYLDTKNVIVHKEIISIGILDASLVHPREVFEPAYRHSCARIILSHNHPSGDTTPSPEDLAITKQLVAASTILGIEILDHIIVGRKSHYSLHEEYSSLFQS